MEWKVRMAEKQSKTPWITAKPNYQKRSENVCSGFATPIHCSRCGRTLRPGARRRNDTRFRVLNTWTGTLPLSSFPTTVGENPMCTRNKGFMCFGTWTRPKKPWLVVENGWKSPWFHHVFRVMMIFWGLTRSKKWNCQPFVTPKPSFRFDANSHWKVDPFRNLCFFCELEVGKSGEIPRQILMICFWNPLHFQKKIDEKDQSGWFKVT